MPRVKAPVSHDPVVCACGCKASFTPTRSTQRYASATCRRRADRQRRALEAGQAEEAKSGTDAEHQLVKAMRTELEAAGVIDTYKAQLALQLGRKLVAPEEKASTVTSLSKEIDRVMADAMASSKATGAATPPAAQDDDEVNQARRRRAEIAAAAAAGT